MQERREYTVSDTDKVWFEYDRQNDILYINFGYDIEDADEELLSGEDVILRIKNGRIVSIMVMGFMEKIGVTIC
ncbi:MAG: DUF2283 domain-containing protein [Thermoprotei archaeon]